MVVGKYMGLRGLRDLIFQKKSCTMKYVCILKPQSMPAYRYTSSQNISANCCTKLVF